MSDAVTDHRRRAPAALRLASLTVSDSRTQRTDGSGSVIRDLATAAGHEVHDGGVVRDEVPAIRAAVEALLRQDGLDAVILSGGTGFSPRDVTLEAVEPLFDRAIPGFGELFRLLSYEEVGAAAMLSRAAAGLVGDRAVYLLPGSPAAVRLALERLILPETGHLLSQARRGGPALSEAPAADPVDAASEGS